MPSESRLTKVFADMSDEQRLAVVDIMSEFFCSFNVDAVDHNGEVWGLHSYASHADEFALVEFSRRRLRNLIRDMDGGAADDDDEEGG